MAFRLIHISDLHFAIPVPSTTHRHSSDYLRELATELVKEPIDRLVVSGDISNLGDIDSLKEARAFLLDTIDDNGQRFGLKLGTMERIVVVPGNHDAYQCARDSSLTRMWQRANVNFRNVFPEKPIDPPYGSGWDWIEKDGEALFIVYADSCYMGDARPGPFRNLFKLARRAARGDISEKQTERFRTLHTDGMSGLLSTPEGKPISKRQFSSAFKVLIMHHYLFTPPGMPWKAELFMRLRQRRKVLLSLALSDFDLVLCGHSHIAHTYRSTYHQHFERKGRKRFTLDYARMVMGVRLFPRVFGARSDRFALSKWSSLVVNLFVRSAFEKDPQRSLSDAEELVVSQLTTAVQSPQAFRESIRDLMSSVVDSGEFLVVPSDLVLLQRRIVAGLSDETRIALAEQSKTMPAILGNFKARPFAQLMSGSTSKFSAPGSPERSFAVYSIDRNAHGWRVDVERRTWNPLSKRFQGPGPTGKKSAPIVFARNRRPSSSSQQAVTTTPPAPSPGTSASAAPSPLARTRTRT
jgi:predicted phosphodiesterase